MNIWGSLLFSIYFIISSPKVHKSSPFQFHCRKSRLFLYLADISKSNLCDLNPLTFMEQ